MRLRGLVAQLCSLGVWLAYAQSACEVTATVARIQGAGVRSELDGTAISTRGTVTALKSNGFYLQMPAPGDGDPATSDGVFVFTSSAVPAPVRVGSDVCVAGKVAEYVPSSDARQPPLTEIISPVVTLLGADQPLPAPVVITLKDTLENRLDNLERFEGMRVAFESLTVVAPTMGTMREASATASSNGIFHAVVTGAARPWREAGIQLADPLPEGAPETVVRFDGNPERIRVDSNAQRGSRLLNVSTGAMIGGVTGVLDYAYRTYTLLPDPDARLEIVGGAMVVPLPEPRDDEFTVASMNVQRFYDHVDDPTVGDTVLTPAAYRNRLNKAGLLIRDVLHQPDIIGVAEAENLPVLQALAAVSGDYEAVLAEGNDPSGIDVGFLVKRSRVEILEAVQYGKSDTYMRPDGREEILNDRPPLLLRARIGGLDVTVIANHLRSLSGIDDPVTGARVRAKRKAQAEYLARLVQARQEADPSERIVVLGDFNATSAHDGYVDLLGAVKGAPAPGGEVVLAIADMMEPDLFDLEDSAAPEDRYTYVYDGSAQSLDHVLINVPLFAHMSRFHAARVNADFPEADRNDSDTPRRLSDHDPVVAYFKLAASTQPGEQVGQVRASVGLRVR